MKISFLILNAYGMGGTIRSTFDLAGKLSERHEVEVISVFQHTDLPFLPLAPRVRLRSLVDLREGARVRWPYTKKAERLSAQESALIHPEERAYSSFTAWSDDVLRRELRRLRTDVLVTTRAGLNIMAARFARRRVVTIAQEHLHFEAHEPGIFQEIQQWYPKLDAVVTLTEADEQDYRAMLDQAPTRVYTIGNGLADVPRPRSRQENRIVLAAGRLVPVKGYDRLLKAFARVVEERPDWKLRIYGEGRVSEKLVKLAVKLRLHNNVTFMGPTGDIEGELAKASIHAVSSRFEGFGMTIIEAFACGVPVVSFDCPRGPREIITSGHDGLLVPPDDVEALAEGLLKMIDDDEGRHRMARNALETARGYDISMIVERWEGSFADLVR
ncbi:glycosyltransferase family 4 protein [Streptosporangium sp. NBC_01756]|uniref:glycosyltransferase family 4 protein n=1 Tax=Streptosporangium sp. NBC_01756 TaxID=2975950 RepID=UPI002DDC2953|nr:glycosyltransferase family 4 protein [Streptosporangium sp. NBC_01756]WSC90052.1 glycosyltransferase family 4 protein [Streptosporangium sp. NBC_01756]